VKLSQSFFSNVHIHSIQDIPLVISTEDANLYGEIRRLPVQVDLVVGNRLYHMSRVVSEVQETAKACWLNAGNIWVFI
jgi:hypothetical protein